MIRGVDVGANVRAFVALDTHIAAIGLVAIDIFRCVFVIARQIYVNDERRDRKLVGARVASRDSV